MSDGTDRLCLALYGREARPRDWLGGNNARMLHDAATVLNDVREILAGAVAHDPERHRSLQALARDVVLRASGAAGPWNGGHDGT